MNVGVLTFKRKEAGNWRSRSPGVLAQNVAGMVLRLILDFYTLNSEISCRKYVHFIFFFSIMYCLWSDVVRAEIENEKSTVVSTSFCELVNKPSYSVNLRAHMRHSSVITALRAFWSQEGVAGMRYRLWGLVKRKFISVTY